MTTLAPETNETATPPSQGLRVFPSDDQMCVPCHVTWNSIGLGSKSCWVCGRPGQQGSKVMLLSPFR